MTRRGVLVLLAGGVAGLAGAWAWLLRRGRGGAPLAEEAPREAPEPLVAPETLPLFLFVANAIVPRSGVSPGAGEIDIMPRIERWAATSPSTRRLYREGWPRLAAAIDAHARGADGQPDADAVRDLLARYLARFRRRVSGTDLGRTTEQIRRDVLRAYYSSPDGRAFVGYDGPAHVASPVGGSH